MKLSKKLLSSLFALSTLLIITKTSQANPITPEDLANLTTVITCTGDPKGADGVVDEVTGILSNYGLCVGENGIDMGKLIYEINTNTGDTEITFDTPRGTIKASAIGGSYYRAPEPAEPPKFMLIAGVADVTPEQKTKELGKYQHVKKILFNVAMDLTTHKCLFGTNGFIEEKAKGPKGVN